MSTMNGSPYLTEEHHMFRAMVREFAEKEVAPLAAHIDETQEFPMQTIKKMGPLGLMGVPFPEELGGAGMDTLAYTIAVEEISRVCAATGITLAAHVSLGTSPIFLFGTDAQKKKYIPPMASGEAIGSFGLTEPEAGSDAGGTKTMARRDGADYVLNGTKIYVTSGRYANTLCVSARTSEGRTTKGISAFIVETKTPGFKVGTKENKLGIRGSDTSVVFFEDCRVPAENLLGAEGEGFQVFMKALEGGRISIGAMALGIAQGAYERSLAYSKERVQFGQPISKFQAVQFMLVDMHTQIEAARHLVYHAAWLKDRGQPIIKESSMAKLYASEAAMFVTTKAIQVHGGAGYCKEFQVERYFRDAKITEIGEGTSEIQRLVIAREILKDAAG
jgi:alkylation response protein AidB-like acyl-CoA dehydrogenase